MRFIKHARKEVICIFYIARKCNFFHLKLATYLCLARATQAHLFLFFLEEAHLIVCRIIIRNK